MYNISARYPIWISIASRVPQRLKLSPRSQKNLEICSLKENGCAPKRKATQHTRYDTVGWSRNRRGQQGQLQLERYVDSRQATWEPLTTNEEDSITAWQNEHDREEEKRNDGGDKMTQGGSGAAACSVLAGRGRAAESDWRVILRSGCRRLPRAERSDFVRCRGRAVHHFASQLQCRSKKMRMRL